MRELREYLNWADSITESVGIVSELKGSERDYRDRESQKGDSRLSQARRENPGMSDGEAILRFTDRQDTEQNKLINALNRENQKLRRTVTDINRELQDLEKHSAETDREVEQILQTTAKTRETTIQTMAKASDIKRLADELDSVKTVNPKQQKQVDELRKQISSLANNNVPSDMLSKLQTELDKVKNAKDIDQKTTYNLANEISNIKQQTVSRDQLDTIYRQMETLKNSDSVSKEEFAAFRNNLAQLTQKNRVADEIITDLNKQAAKISSLSKEQKNTVGNLISALKREQKSTLSSIASQKDELEKLIAELEILKSEYSPEYMQDLILDIISNVKLGPEKDSAKFIDALSKLSGLDTDKISTIVKKVDSQDEKIEQILDREEEHDREIDRQQEINDKQDEIDATHDSALKGLANAVSSIKTGKNTNTKSDRNTSIDSAIKMGHRDSFGIRPHANYDKQQKVNSTINTLKWQNKDIARRAVAVVNDFEFNPKNPSDPETEMLKYYDIALRNIANTAKESGMNGEEFMEVVKDLAKKIIAKNAEYGNYEFYKEQFIDNLIGDANMYARTITGKPNKPNLPESRIVNNYLSEFQDYCSVITGKYAK